MKTMINSIILTTYLTIMQPDQAFGNNQDAAIRHFSKAMYLQLELDKDVDRLEKRYITSGVGKDVIEHLEKLEKKYMTREVRTYGPIIVVAVKIATEHRVSYTWTF